ncbi:MAG: 50S ribosomal protein L3 N(5)-glutamine methyltransferase [Rhodoferax sp.]|nr:50S ribosomal protein L3 N(5)-glutamine methyltransferase [Rhodoferax sp.]
MTLISLIEACADQLTKAGVSFGHGTTNARDEAVWLVLWRLGLPLDTQLDGDASLADTAVPADQEALVQALVAERIRSRKPAAYLTHEAWLQGFSFYVDERTIVPRSLIAELLVEGGIDYFLHAATHKVLDLCTGNGSLAVIAASVYPDVTITASDLSLDALAVAAINLQKHGLQDRITLVASDGLAAPELASQGPFDLILCNPPYVNRQSMADLPPEYRAEPAMALDGNIGGGSDGMDFVRDLLQGVAAHLNPQGVLVLEIGNERPYFEAAFPSLEVIWLETSAGEDQVLLLTRETLNS